MIYNEPLVTISFAIMAFGWIYQYAVLHKGEKDMKTLFILTQLLGMSFLSLSGYFNKNYPLTLIAAASLVSITMVAYKIWTSDEKIMEKIAFHNVDKEEIKEKKEVSTKVSKEEKSKQNKKGKKK
ncbi:MAG: hypothetical protein N3E37_04045 [Candidatus Micrarchaeota archaeon]|nr:hypothetical protein [Candidatus Micrarchaeota archaeon]